MRPSSKVSPHALSQDGAILLRCVLESFCETLASLGIATRLVQLIPSVLEIISDLLLHYWNWQEGYSSYVGLEGYGTDNQQLHTYTTSSLPSGACHSTGRRHGVVSQLRAEN